MLSGVEHAHVNILWRVELYDDRLYEKKQFDTFYLHVSLEHFRLQSRLWRVLFLVKSSEPEPPVYRLNMNLDSGSSSFHVFRDLLSRSMSELSADSMHTDGHSSVNVMFSYVSPQFIHPLK